MRVIALIFVLAATGCTLTQRELDADCSGVECPTGYTCEEGECVVAALSSEQAPDAAAPLTAADAGPQDADVAPPDAAPIQLQSCGEQFGLASGYLLCAEQPSTCEFFSQTAGGTCADLCASLGSTCVDAYDSSADAPCTVQSADGCLAAHTTQTCICERGAAAQ